MTQIIKVGQGAKVSITAEIGFMNEKTPITFQQKAVYIVFLAEISDGQCIYFARAR